MKKKSTSKSAFFKLHLLLGLLFCFAGITIVLLAQPQTPSAQPGNSQPVVQAQFRGVLPVVPSDSCKAFNQPTEQTTKQPNNQTTKQPNNQTTKQPKEYI